MSYRHSSAPSESLGASDRTDRAAARGMAPATYVSVLTRAHLRSLAPLPKDELQALKRTVGELGSIRSDGPRGSARDGAGHVRFRTDSSSLTVACAAAEG